ncbi:uncharacterized protein BDV14DRAFT_32337 [Aspergillus stella-maris]|uniref:uncharacterized protein n=1 Tax=Aspergillus stella-maris TaxID=1810926 RepID=UPI003CCC9693
MSHLQGKGATPSGNQPTSSTRGGASAYPTPANNTGGGAGWGDSGILKGGLEGASNRLSSSSGESHPSKLSSMSGELSSLSEQKHAGEQRYQQDVDEAGGVPAPAPGDGDADFMKTKPGGSDTLPGWEGMKKGVNSMMGNE